MKPFEEFINEGTVRKGRIDQAKVQSLIKTSDKTLIAAFTLPSEQGESIVTLAYSSLRQLLEAIALKEGLHFYSHEAYTAYLVSKKDKVSAVKFDKYRKIRNGIEYYGENINKRTALTAREDIKKLREKLKKTHC